MQAATALSLKKSRCSAIHWMSKSWHSCFFSLSYFCGLHSTFELTLEFNDVLCQILLQIPALSQPIEEVSKIPEGQLICKPLTNYVPVSASGPQSISHKCVNSMKDKDSIVQEEHFAQDYLNRWSGATASHILSHWQSQLTWIFVFQM